MGYRIELEEIEHGLARLPGVIQAAVIYHRTETAFGKLIGFVSSSEALDEATLQRHLALLVPDYMVPSRVIVTDRLPMNPNGKIDRQNLATLLVEHGK
jgi:D-alanine--poly(phosphoribitol) ligase subunit 1